jgi:hypothetical protein
MDKTNGAWEKHTEAIKLEAVHSTTVVNSRSKPTRRRHFSCALAVVGEDGEEEVAEIMWLVALQLLSSGLRAFSSAAFMPLLVVAVIQSESQSCVLAFLDRLPCIR